MVTILHKVTKDLGQGGEIAKKDKRDSRESREVRVHVGT